MFIVDSNLYPEAKAALAKIDLVFELKSQGLVYDAISGHPDIFICPIQNTVFLAPNAPIGLVEAIEKHCVSKIIFGESPLGGKYPNTAKYNLAYSTECSVGNAKNLDAKLLKATLEASCNFVSVRQAYSRCNLLWLGSKYICSDKGIEKELLKRNYSGVYIEPKPIILKGFDYGFIGGCAGTLEQNKTLFFSGSLSFLEKAEETAIRQLAEEEGYNIVELSRERLLDVGSILHIN